MVSREILKRHGITPETLRRKFESLPFPFGSGVGDKPSEPIERLAFRVRSRVQDGQANNFRHFKLFYAIDQAFEVPFRQISPTLAQSLAKGDYDESVYAMAKEFELTHLIQETKDDKTGKQVKRLVLPAFFNIFVPLVRAYTIIRAAKLTNDRELVPYFKFDPIRSNAINRARCEIITDRVEAMATQMGYRDVARQAILKMLCYGTQLQFIQEEWWHDKQLCDYLNDNGEFEERETILREGLRYHLPHPTRTYWDQAHPLSSLNTNTGCQFAGYWRVRRFRDVKAMGLWNTDRIAFNSNLRETQSIYFQTVYNSCTLAFPQACSKWTDNDREGEMAQNWYTSDFADSAIVLAEHFEVCNPKKDGLGDYDYPVWFRFVLGGDGTILYAAPLPDGPVLAWNYDPDESKTLTPSLALEILPFQDQISNLLTQALLSVRQNLANLTFVDQDIVDEKALREIENMGEAQFRKLNFMRFSGRKTRAAQQDVRFAFGSVRFPQLDVPSILNAINAVLAVLERVLVMSAQEIAGQATHEQSKQEILTVQQSTSTRLNYTAGQVDRAFDAWKRQLYTYLMAFGASEIYAQLSQDPEYTKELLNMLGFTFEKARTFDGKHYVEGNKKALQLEYFSSTREGAERINDTALAQAMLQMLSAALQNPMIAQVIGPQQSVMLINQILEQMGLPRDFKLRAMPPETNSSEQQQWLQQQLLDLTKSVKQFVQQQDAEVQKQFKEQLKPLADAIKQAMQLGKDNQRVGQGNQTQLANIVKLLTELKTKENQAPKLTIGAAA